MLLELQAFLQPLAVLAHAQLPLLGGARDPRRRLPLDHRLLLGAHEHLPELLQPPLHLSDDALALLHLEEMPPRRRELHARAGGHEPGGGGCGGRRAGEQSLRHPPEVAHGDGAPGGRRGQRQQSRGRRRRRHCRERKRGRR